MARKRRKPAPIGIDIGATGVKALQLVDGPAGVEVVAAAYCTLAPATDDFEAGRPRLKQAIIDSDPILRGYRDLHTAVETMS